MSVPRDTVEEITRVVLRVLEEHRPASGGSPSRAARLWAWIAEHPTLPFAFAAFVVVATIAWASFGVTPLTIAGEITRDYRQAQERNDVVRDHLRLGDRFLGAEELRPARTEFKQALELESTNVEAQRGLFRATLFEPIEQEDYEPAVAEMRLEHLIELDKNDADAHAFLGDVARDQFYYDRALGHFKAAWSADENLPHAYAGAGLVYSEQGKSKKAVAMYRRAVALAPTSRNYRNNLAYELFRSGQYVAAKNEYESLRRADPQDLLLHHGAANAYRILGDLENARRFEAFAVGLFEDRKALALKRNKVPTWFVNIGGEVVSLSGYPEKRVYVLLTFGLTTFLQGNVKGAQQAATRAKQIRLTREQARSVRKVLFYDIALLTNERKNYRAAARTFTTEVLGDFGS